jgi:hypothetical protein
MKRALILMLMILAATVLITGCDDDEVTIYKDVPAVPVGVFSITGDGYVDIIWQSNNDNGITAGYGVYRFVGYVGDQEEYELIATVDAGIGAVTESYRDYDVVNGVTEYYAVNAFNEVGESELSYEDVFDTPRPQGNLVVRDFWDYPAQSGVDFFPFPPYAQVGHWDLDNPDIYFEYDTENEAFFFWVGGIDYQDVDIQDYGYIDDIKGVGWGDPGGTWSEVGWMELLEGHGYVVWTADNYFAAFRVNYLNYGSKSINITWSFQTDQGNPELKRRPLERPEHDDDYGKRKG